MPSCPECSSKKIWKAGNRYVDNLKVQRFLCRDCGFRFTDPEFTRKSVLNKNQQSGSCQICVPLTKEAKNLAAEQQKEVLQETKTKGTLVNFSWHLKINGRSEATVKTYTRLLKVIDKEGNLNDTTSVKSVIATHFKDRNSKRLAVSAYSAYLKYVGGTWEKPDYKPEHKQTFIPTEQELKLAMNSGTKENVIFSIFLFETGARRNEAQRLEWTDLDKERGIVTVKSSKNGNARSLSVSNGLMNMLFSLPKNQETVFRASKGRSSAFNGRMNRLAKIYGNPRLKKIHLHTFRHCKALREYHKTRDVLHVMGVLGHQRIDTTYRYVRLYHQIYKPQQVKHFMTRIASTKQERCDLINDGWDLVEKDGEDWYFRKPE